MLRLLIPHPETPPSAQITLEARAERGQGRRLTLIYVLAGEIDRILIPPLGATGPADELWRTTCFEAFIQPAGGTAYLELNLAPSGAWAIYAFDSERQGMKPALMPAPLIAVNAGGTRFALRVDVNLAALPDGPWRVGLTAVIEEKGGRKSYFALAHPSGKPDFHDSRGFALELAP